MGVSSSQIEIPPPSPIEMGSTERTPSTSASRELDRDLQASALKSSQQYLAHLAQTSPSLYNLINDNPRIRPTKRRRLVSPIIPVQTRQQLRQDNSPPYHRSSPPLRTNNTEVQLIERLVDAGTSPDIDHIAAQEARLVPQPAHVHEEEHGQSREHGESDARALHLLPRFPIAVDDWLNMNSPAPPDEMPLVEDDGAQQSAQHTQQPRKRKRGHDQVEDVYKFPASDEKQVSKPILPSKSTTLPPAPRKRLKSLADAGTTREETHFSNHELRLLDEAFEAFRKENSMTTSELRQKLALQGPSEIQRRFGIEAQKVLPLHKLGSVKTHYRSLVELGFAERVSGPFSAVERDIANRVFKDFCIAQGIAHEDMRVRVLQWHDKGTAPFREAIQNALPRRVDRSLKDFFNRKFKDSDVLDQTDGRNVEHRNSAGRSSPMVVIPVQESAQHVSEVLTAPQTNVLDCSSSGIPVEEVVHQTPTKSPPRLQQPTPGASSPSEPRPSSIDQGIENKKVCMKACRKPARVPSAALGHLNLFDPGDYYDILKDTMSALRDNYRLLALIPKDRPDPYRDLAFWRAITKILKKSRFNSIGDDETIACVRRLAFRTAIRNFKVSEAIRNTLDSPDNTIKVKSKALLAWLLETENQRDPMLLCRSWRADLVDCTREEVAGILYSEELELSQHWNHSWDNDDPILVRARQIGSRRLNDALARLAKAREQARRGRANMAQSGG